MEISNPLISIIIPTFNASQFLHDAIQSIQNQTYKNWECLIVDDGSSDNTLNLSEGYSENDSRIKSYKRNRNPKGANVCRNIGLEKSAGKYVIYFDADDLLLPFCLEQRVKMMEKRPKDLFGVFNQKVFTDSIENSYLFTQLHKKNILYCVLATDNIWQTMGAIWKRDFLVKIGGFDEHMHIFDDDVLHLRALIYDDVKYSFYPNLPFDCYYRNCQRENDPIYCNLVYENLDKYIKKILHQYFVLISDKKLLSISISAAFAKLLVYFIWSKSKDTNQIRNTLQFLIDKKVTKKTDIAFFTKILKQIDNMQFDNSEESDALVFLLWERFKWKTTFIQNNQLKRNLRETKNSLKKLLQIFRS